MRSNIGRKLVEATPLEDKIFVRKYAEIVLRVQAILEQQNLSQRELAERMGKSPSELSRWLKGEHNLTLRSLAKLEAELGETIISIPRCDAHMRELPKQNLASAEANSVSDGNWIPVSVSHIPASRRSNSPIA